MPLKTFDALDYWKHKANTNTTVNLYNWCHTDKLVNTLYKPKAMTNTRSPSTSSSKLLPKLSEQEDAAAKELKEIIDKYNDYCLAQHRYNKCLKLADKLVAQCSATISKESPILLNKYSFVSGSLHNNSKVVKRKKKSKRVKIGSRNQYSLNYSNTQNNTISSEEKSKALNDFQLQLISVKNQMLPLKLFTKKIKLEIYQSIQDLFACQNYPKSVSLTWAIKKIWGIGYKFDEGYISNMLDEKSMQFLFTLAALEEKHDKLNKDKEKLSDLTKLMSPLKNIKSRIIRPTYNNLRNIMHTYCQTTNRSTEHDSSEDSTPKTKNSQIFNNLKGPIKCKKQLREITSQLILVNEEIRNITKQEEERIEKYFINSSNYSIIKGYLFGQYK